MLEKKKLKAELMRVQAAKAEMDYLIEQKLEEVQRIKDSMHKQELAEQALQEKIRLIQE